MTLSMNREIAIEWIDTLESLDPEMQGESVLKNARGQMCCLGVLTEIACEKGIVEAHVNSYKGYTEYHEPGEDPVWGEARYLPKAVIKWAEIESHLPSGGGYNKEESHNNPYFQGDYAAVMNDSLKLSFKDIAARLRLEFDLPKTD